MLTVVISVATQRTKSQDDDVSDFPQLYESFMTLQADFDNFLTNWGIFEFDHQRLSGCSKCKHWKYTVAKLTCW